MSMSGYDRWKTRSPDDEYGMERPPLCAIKPKLDEDDVCLYCGARPDQLCKG